MPKYQFIKVPVGIQNSGSNDCLIAATVNSLFFAWNWNNVQNEMGKARVLLKSLKEKKSSALVPFTGEDYTEIRNDLASLFEEFLKSGQEKIYNLASCTHAEKFVKNLYSRMAVQAGVNLFHSDTICSADAIAAENNGTTLSLEADGDTSEKSVDKVSETRSSRHSFAVGLNSSSDNCTSCKTL